MPIFILNEVLMILYSLVNGWLFAKLHSYISAISLLGKIKRFKNDSLRESKVYLSSELSFSEFSNSLFYPYNIVLLIYWKLIYRFL